MHLGWYGHKIICSKRAYKVDLIRSEVNILVYLRQTRRFCWILLGLSREAAIFSNFGPLQTFSKIFLFSCPTKAKLGNCKKPQEIVIYLLDFYSFTSFWVIYFFSCLLYKIFSKLFIWLISVGVLCAKLNFKPNL